MTVHATSSPLSLTLFSLAVGLYLAAFVGFVLYVPFRIRRLADGALALVALGWPVHASSIVARAIEAGHWPLGNMYEYSTGISFVMVTTFLVVAVRHGQRLIGVPTMMCVLALLAVAYMLYVPPGQLVPALHSY